MLIEHKLHVANSRESSQLHAIITPNKDFRLADWAVDLVIQELFSIDDLPPIESFKDLFHLLIDIRKKENMIKSKEALYEFISKVGILISPRKVENVLAPNKDPFQLFKPSFISSLFGAKDVTLFLLDQQFQITYFNSNSDSSWIVGGDLIYRAKYGTLCPIWISLPSMNF